jgi:hypothetical protein
MLLAREGFEWLLSRLEALLRNLRDALSQVRFQRYETLATVLLLQPVETTERGVARHALNSEDLYYRLWQPADVLRAGLFLLPEALAGPGQTVSPISENPFDADERKRRNCSSCTGGNMGGSEWHYCGHGNCSGIDCSFLDCSDLDCGTLDCCGPDCCKGDCSGCGDLLGSGDCSGIDCGGGDCSGADCGGADCNF